MRSIKFRAWYNGVMLLPNNTYGDIRDEVVLSLFGECFYISEESNGNFCPSSLVAKTKPDIILMQFTGLHDKNGKEIYEGDVWRTDFMKGVVVFEDGCFTFRAHQQPYSLTARDHNIQAEEFEIIGNIHEHPTLLTKTT